MSGASSVRSTTSSINVAYRDLPGLVLLPSTLICMSTQEVVRNATNLAHIVDAASPWIKRAFELIPSSLQDSFPALFDDALLKYQASHARQLGLSEERFWDEDSDDEEVQGGFFSRCSKTSARVFGDKMPYLRGDSECEALTVCRHITVWTASLPYRVYPDVPQPHW